ncbi:MAG TPA: fibronectin type III domain-containing protein, partial [Pirellulaceae bacterium]|nr:fibronectin type III domain-containing protein [Pirellulaceae bacterium]
FKDLAADTAYQVRVAARNLDLDSLTVWSDWMPVRTRAFVAPSATTATALGPTSVRVSFAHDGVGVKEFQIQKQNQAGDWVVHATGISPQVRSVDLSNGPTKLIPGVAYPFRVVAVYASTSVVGVASPAVRLPNATGPQNVQVPDSTIGRQKLTATWSAPSPAWDVADYRVELYRTGNLATPWKTIVVDKSVTSATFTDLDINTSYRVRVLARNLDLDLLSVASVFAAASTKGFVAPASLSFSGVTATALTVNWLHSDPVGAPESYVIFRNGARVGEVSATTRSFTDRGLKANTTYSYVVRAKYALGNADSGAASQRTALK